MFVTIDISRDDLLWIVGVLDDMAFADHDTGLEVPRNRAFDVSDALRLQLNQGGMPPRSS